eukprot:1160104-Pelagomonas_calceolata.AAC.12
MVLETPRLFCFACPILFTGLLGYAACPCICEWGGTVQKLSPKRGSTKVVARCGRVGGKGPPTDANGPLDSRVEWLEAEAEWEDK